jgi:hypothetical protein
MAERSLEMIKSDDRITDGIRKKLLNLDLQRSLSQHSDSSINLPRRRIRRRNATQVSPAA